RSGIGRGTQNGGQVMGGLAGESGVAEDPGGVDDSGERMLVRNARQQGGELIRIGGVAGGDGDVGTKVGQLGVQLSGGGGVKAAAAGKQEVTHAVAGDQVTGGESGEGAGAAGDQNGAVGVEGSGLVVGGCCSGESGDEGLAVADGELGFVVGVMGEGGGDAGG